MGRSKAENRGPLRAVGKEILDREGNAVRLRGVGLGSWTLPEGYMWKFPNQGDRPRRMERAIRDWIGEGAARDFWRRYYAAFISEDDVRAIAAAGFDSIRIPINARFLLPDQNPGLTEGEAWSSLDRMIDWCEKYDLWAILDLHGAPGGQTGQNIDDSERDEPELFTIPEHRRTTVELWRRIALRYRDRGIVAGYDLLNEPLPNWSAQYNHLVMPLYREIIAAIREVDRDHMIILEGVHWATDWSIFTELPDDNVLLQFHKYWSEPDTESIRHYLDARERLNAPIFMGEGGENNPDWFCGAFGLYDDHDISWNFWTWKKMAAVNSPCSIDMPEGWGALVASLENGTPLSADFARRVLEEFLRNMEYERCAKFPGVVNALFRRVPYRHPAIFYGNGGAGVDHAGGGPCAAADPAPDRAPFRATDKIAIRLTAGEKGAVNFRHVAGEPWAKEDWMHIALERGEWCRYRFEIDPSGRGEQALALSCRWKALTDDASVSVRIDDSAAAEFSGAGNDWLTETRSFGGPFAAGPHVFKVFCEQGTAAIEWLAWDRA
jgi:hypothetical protein